MNKNNLKLEEKKYYYKLNDNYRTIIGQHYYRFVIVDLQIVIILIKIEIELV